MKFLIILAIAVAAAHAASVDIPIVRSSYDSTPEGNYHYAYETGDGTSAQADGIIKNPNSDHPAAEVHGSVHYISPDGSPVDITYVANEDGYQPQGNVIPQAPEVPEAIVRSLQYIAAHPPPPEKKYF